MKNSVVLLWVLALLLIINTGCESTGTKPDESRESLRYSAVIIKETSVSTELTLPGELDGYYETGIMAKVNGYIRHLYVDIGDKVITGQLLAELEAPELTSQLAGAYSEVQAREAIYLGTKGKFKRLTQTNKTQGAVSPYDMDLALISLKSDSLGYLAAKAKYEAIQELVNYLKIVAPFDGIVTERALAPGAFVGPNDKMGLPLLRLKSESKLRLHISVPERNLGQISLGDLVQFSVKSFPQKIFTGRITRLSRNLSMQTRAEIVEVEVDNRSGELLPGMYATTVLPLKRTKPSLVVPETAIVTNMERSFVIKVVKGSTTHYVDVEKGESNGGGIEVFGKLVAGDTILAAGTDELKDKSSVSITISTNY